MSSVIIGFVMGVALLQQQASLLLIWWYLLGLLIAAYWFLDVKKIKRLSVYFHHRFTLAALSFLMSVLAGVCWAGLCATWVMSEELPIRLQGKDIQVVGIIANLPSSTTQGTRFQFNVEEVLPHADFPPSVLKQVPKKLSLAWFSSVNQSANQSTNAADKTSIASTEYALKPGQRWQMTVRLKRPHGNANPNGFDYEVWLLEQGIRATGTVQIKHREYEQNAQQNKLISNFVWTLSNVVERARFLLRERINKALPDALYAGVIVALVVGDQREVSQADWQIFNRTGIGHLVSISGLHITMIAALFSGLMYFLWRHSFFTQAALPLLIPAQKVAALSGVIAALVYVALAGFGVPAQRTLLMLMVVAVAMWAGRLTNITAILCLALGLVVVFDPWAVLWPGFWLSFFAVAILLYVSVGRSMSAQVTSHSHLQDHTNTDSKPSSKYAQYWDNLRKAAHMQYAITIGLLPLSLLLFGQVSLISPIANAVAIPLVSFVVTPLALIGSVLPSSMGVVVLSAAHFCMASLAQLLTYLSTSSLAVWQVPSPSPFMFLLAFVGTLWMLAPRGWPLRFLGIFCWLPILLQTDTSPKVGAMQVTTFDVGQGSSLLIETAHHRLLYDTGPAYSLESNSGTRVLLPYLQSRGIKRLDAMVVSHADTDHSGGALSILTNIQVAQTMSSLPLEHVIVQQSAKPIRCQTGQAWDWDGIHFEILHPIAASYDSNKWKTNARSCTLKISTQFESILLPGDIEAIQEDELVNMTPEKLPATVLLAPHHGSGTSSTLPFLHAVQPNLALFQVGYQNRYRHPKPEVWQRYMDLYINSIRTDQSGSITLQFSADKHTQMQVEQYRKTHARYWYQTSAKTE